MKSYKYELETMETEGKMVKLKDVCTIQKGFSFDNKKFKSYGKPILRATNIKKSGLTLDRLVYFSDNDYKKDLEKFACSNGDIVMSTTGDHSGTINMIRRTSGNFYLSSTVCKFCPDTTQLDPDFFFHFLLSIEGKIKETIIDKGIQTINFEKLNQIDICLPPMVIQNEISRMLSKFTELERELKIEIQERRKQYKHYRTQMIEKKGWTKGF